MVTSSAMTSIDGSFCPYHQSGFRSAIEGVVNKCRKLASTAAPTATEGVLLEKATARKIFCTCESNVVGDAAQGDSPEDASTEKIASLPADIAAWPTTATEILRLCPKGFIQSIGRQITNGTADSHTIRAAMILSRFFRIVSMAQCGQHIQFNCNGSPIKIPVTSTSHTAAKTVISEVFPMLLSAQDVGTFIGKSGYGLCAARSVGAAVSIKVGILGSEIRLKGHPENIAKAKSLLAQRMTIVSREQEERRRAKAERTAAKAARFANRRSMHSNSRGGPSLFSPALQSGKDAASDLYERSYKAAMYGKKRGQYGKHRGKSARAVSPKEYHKHKGNGRVAKSSPLTSKSRRRELRDSAASAW